jgi:predicted extracellular nuclease
MADFNLGPDNTPTAGTGDTPPPPGEVTLISAIQGSGEASPLVGQTVTLEAIVVGDFQDGDGDNRRNLRGFYVQEEDVDSDNDAATSEGIFIFEGANFITDVTIGDKVRITGLSMSSSAKPKSTPSPALKSSVLAMTCRLPQRFLCLSPVRP